MDIIDEILNVINNHNSFVISTHVNPEGDALGSQFGLYSFLKELRKKVSVVNTDPIPDVYSFLPFSDIISFNPPKEQFEILMVSDAGSLDRIGTELSNNLTPQKAIINIDHHVTNDRFGHYNFVDANACAASELVYKIIKRHGMNLGLKRAICLYTGIMVDTGSFRFSNTTPEAHRITAELIAEGVPVSEIYKTVYENLPSSRVKLLALALNTLQFSLDERIAWFHVTQSMFANTGTNQDDTENFINHINAIGTVEISMFFVELENGKTKVSLRSKGDLDVSKVANSFGGGGHQRAAGCTVEANLYETERTVIDYVQRKLAPLMRRERISEIS